MIEKCDDRTTIQPVELRMLVGGRCRSDQMPYGGVKASGIGREGPRYAIRDMTEERLVIFNL
jgi:acyl-CoA reductase-like NAD-dependent aldehyde dehydrogenase